MVSRRGHGEGSIYQRASDGRWVALVDLGHVNGKRKRKPIYGKTRKEVADKLKRILADQQLGRPVVTNERQTVGEFLNSWLPTVKGQVRPTTYVQY